MNYLAAFVLRLAHAAASSLPWTVWLAVPVGCARSTLRRAADAYEVER